MPFCFSLTFFYEDRLKCVCLLVWKIAVTVAKKQNEPIMDQ